MKTSFMERLEQRSKSAKSMVCVGLDPELEKIPAYIRKQKNPIYEFCKKIVDAVADQVCAFKPQIAYFSALGAESQLELTITHIKKKHPKIPIILDAKRGDIGSTAEKYAIEAFERYGADAVTVNPYLGYDSIAPFLEYKNRGVILLCRTSNPSSSELQNLTIDRGQRLFHRVADLAATKWNKNKNIGLVVGATFPEELRQVRALVGDIPILVPGVGAQGGDVNSVVKVGLNSKNMGLVINSSRAILYAGSGKDFARCAAAASEELRSAIAKAVADRNR